MPAGTDGRRYKECADSKAVEVKAVRRGLARSQGGLGDGYLTLRAGGAELRGEKAVRGACG
jgi:hypothetical protein